MIISVELALFAEALSLAISTKTTSIAKSAVHCYTYLLQKLCNGKTCISTEEYIFPSFLTFPEEYT